MPLGRRSNNECSDQDLFLILPLFEIAERKNRRSSFLYRPCRYILSRLSFQPTAVKSLKIAHRWYFIRNDLFHISRTCYIAQRLLNSTFVSQDASTPLLTTKRNESTNWKRKRRKILEGFRFPRSGHDFLETELRQLELQFPVQEEATLYSHWASLRLKAGPSEN